MPIAYGTATDWTNGTGTFTAGTISLPADNDRQWLYVQNRDVGEVTIQYSGNYANGSSGVFSPIALNGASQSGYAGGSEEREATVFMPARGAVTITGTAGQKITVLTA